MNTSWPKWSNNLLYSYITGAVLSVALFSAVFPLCRIRDMNTSWPKWSNNLLYSYITGAAEQVWQYRRPPNQYFSTNFDLTLTAGAGVGEHGHDYEALGTRLT